MYQVPVNRAECKCNNSDYHPPFLIVFFCTNGFCLCTQNPTERKIIDNYFILMFHLHSLFILVHLNFILCRTEPMRREHFCAPRLLYSCDLELHGNIFISHKLSIVSKLCLNKKLNKKLSKKITVLEGYFNISF